MKAKTLSMMVAAGFGGALLLGEAAPAAFMGLDVEAKPNGFGLTVCNVYAIFDNPNDVMIAVAGTPMNPLNIEVIGGTFYQHAFGNDQAPNPDLILAFPSLAYDTFVTIGKKTSTGDQTGLTPNWPGFGASLLPTDPVDAQNIGWFITPDEDQGRPDENGHVLIGQYSTADGSVIQGTMLLSYVADGGSIDSIHSFFHVPVPGAWALLGAVGVRRGRRRSAA